MSRAAAGYDEASGYERIVAVHDAHHALLSFSADGCLGKQVAAIVGPRIRRTRRRLDMSQEALAENAEIHRTQMTAIEWGERLPRIDTLIKLAGGLGVSPCELLDGITWEVRGSRPGRWSRSRVVTMVEMPRPNTRFAANLRRLREAAVLSQEALAFRAVLHRTQISLLENGGRMPRVHTLVCLVGALDATPNDLLDGITWEPVVATGGGLVV